MNLRRIFLAACLAASFAAARPAAAAQYGDACYGGYGGWGYGGYWDIGRLYAVLANNVPYYAAFPPVYYSVPVPRTYGYSPFAYPPGVMTPEVEIAEPLSINNPYVNGVDAMPAADAEPAQSAAPADRTTSAPTAPRPQTIINPFVVDSAYAQR
jgi:hypothetical protein